MREFLVNCVCIFSITRKGMTVKERFPLKFDKILDFCEEI